MHATTEVRPPRRLLLATDLSARCDRALDRAASLAQYWQADLVAVHALEIEANAGFEEARPSWKGVADPLLVAEDQLRRDAPAGVTITAVVETGDPAEVILRNAHSRGGDLLVTGLARDETLGRFWPGTTVDRLLRRSRLPLLIVRQRARGPYRHLVIATDFSASSRHALLTALALFPDARIDIAYAYEAPMAGLTGDAERYRERYREVAMADCAAFLAAAGLSEEQKRRFGFLVEHGEPTRLITAYVRERQIDLLVVGANGRNAAVDVFLGSTARDLLHAAPCDVLAVREPGAPVEVD